MKEVLRLDHGVLTHFPASDGRNKPALILCPGGGYEYCPSGRAHRSRVRLRGTVWKRSCSSTTGTEVPLGVKPLHTLSASVAWVREHAAQLGIAADRIAVGGFSAGAHLAGLLAATWHDADWFPAGTDLQAHRPNAAVLCYPVVSAGAYAHRGSFVRLVGENAAEQQRFSLETLVSARMPRTFLWHTLTDATVPVENTLLLEAALRRENISHELHLFPHGVHGLALADLETADPMKGRVPDRHINRWQALCAEWLKEE
ncbi:MAG: alpha/beta hydrolase [Butyricicoccus sp.]